MKVNKGDTVLIKGNTIMGYMGLKTVQGEVFLVRPDGVSFKCKETGAIETADFDDGHWTVKTP